MNSLISRLQRPGYDLQKEQAIQEAIVMLRQCNAQSKPDCGEAGHNEGRCGNAQCLPGAQAQPAPSVPEGVSFIDTSQLAGVVSTEIMHSYPPPSGWLHAIDEALVTAHIGVANAHDTYEQAKAKLDNLIGFHVDVATDPAVNGGWKLMPVEPTEEVYQCFSAYDGTSYSNPFDRDEFLKDWRAALAVSPEAKP